LEVLFQGFRKGNELREGKPFFLSGQMVLPRKIGIARIAKVNDEGLRLTWFIIYTRTIEDRS